MIYKHIIKPLLFSLDPEDAHSLTFRLAAFTGRHTLLKAAASSLYGFGHPLLQQDVLGLRFQNPVGLAAGFDKNARLLHMLPAVGFGHLEIGSVTAQASSGNPKPRAFRLNDDQGLINRMGLNNIGTEAVVQSMQAAYPVPVGINIAKTHDPSILGDAAIEDYVVSFRLARQKGDYITINISCPNTTEGKTFEDPAALRELLAALFAWPTQKPVLVKLSNDLERPALEALLDICESFPVSGYVISNTSTRRDGLRTPAEVLQNIGTGGLSGHPIAARSTALIRETYALTSGKKPIIGVGGVMSAGDAITKLCAGASLVQVYTGLIYEGPGLAGRINRGIVRYMEKHGLSALSDLTGSH